MPTDEDEYAKRRARAEAAFQEPVPYDEHVRAVEKEYEAKRQVFREANAEDMAKEIEATIGGIDDPEMKSYNAEEKARIEAKWAAKLAEQLAKVDEEERKRLERVNALYGRDGRER